MTQIHWLNAISGGFTNPADWDGGMVPGASDDALLDPAGTTSFTVTSSATVTVDSIQTAAIATLDITTGEFTATAGTGTGADAGTVFVANNATLTLGGSFSDTGTLSLNATVSKSDLLVAAGGATLGGAGQLSLTDCATNLIFAAAPAAVLTNTDVTITGAGNIGGGQLELVNGKLGVINATGTIHALNLYPESLSNAGLIETTGAGGLSFQGPSQITNTGTINAQGSGALVFEGYDGVASLSNAGLVETTGTGGLRFLNGTQITNTGTIKAWGSGALTVELATITSSGTGVILTRAHSHVTLDYGTITGGAVTIVAGATLNAYAGPCGLTPATLINAGAISIPNGSELVMAGSVVNSGTIALLNSFNQTELRVGVAGLTLTGGGLVTMTASNNNSIYGITGTPTLTNVDNTISGAGDIGFNHLIVVNKAGGVINATSSSAPLELVPNTLANAGLLEATGGGWLSLGIQTFANSGTILAGGASTVAVSYSTISGGTFIELAGGDLYDRTSSSIIGALITNSGEIKSGARFTLASDTVTNAGGTIQAGFVSVVLLNNTTVYGSGVSASLLSTVASSEIEINNASVVQIQGTSSNAGTIAIASTTSLTDLCILSGGASLTGGGTVSLSGPNSRILGASASATLTNVDNTIFGTGVIGAKAMTLVNEAGGVIEATGLLTVRDGAGQTVTNAGLMEANATGQLALVSETINQSGGGVILAAGGLVTLQAVDFIGGTLTTTGAGRINVDGGGAALDGSSGAVTNAGLLQVTGGVSLTLDGAITNGGKLNTHGGSKVSELIVGADGVTLSAGGQVNLSASANNIIVGAAAGDTLTNVDNRIAGAGDIGDGSMVLVNKGQIVGSTAVTLTLDTGASMIANSGTISAVSTGQVVVKSAVANTGLLFAAAGTLTLDGAVTGAGTAQVKKGVLNIAASFGETVTFVSGATGQLRLTDWKDFTGTVKGLSLTGTNTIDLAGFTKTGATVSYSGTTASGVLTVTNGTQTAKIHLTGNYAASTFTLANDGHGGVLVKDPAVPALPAHALITGLAGFAASVAGSAVLTRDLARSDRLELARPGTMSA